MNCAGKASQCLTTWPPIVTLGKVDISGRVTIPPVACLDDVVTDARSVSPNTITLDLLNREREEYKISLPLAPSLQAKVLVQIAKQRRISLREVGELRI